MPVDTTDDTEGERSSSIEANSLDRYSTIETDGGSLILYDENDESDAWIQSDVWTTLATDA